MSAALDPAEVAAWTPEAGFWLLVLLSACALAGVAVLVLVHARVRRLEELARRLDLLEDMRGVLERLAGAREELDLRRIEHVLVDLRDGQRTLGEAMLRMVEGRDAADVPGAATPLSERVVSRLNSLGFERVAFVSRPDEVDAIGAGDGEVHVEAQRQGVLHKGRVAVRAGRISAVDLRSIYTAFP